MAQELKRITESDYPRFVKNLDLTYGFDHDPDEDTFKPLLEFDRALGHTSGDRIVSTLSAFSLEMSVPGGVVNCGGTTIVSVAPSHRRQGLLSELMKAHLDDVRDRDEPIAALWASESEIYGRYGYGRATDSAKITVNRPYPKLAEGVAMPSPSRVIEKDEAEKTLPSFHDTLRVSQPGMFKRTAAWWENRIFRDLPSRRSGYTANRWAVVDGPDGIEGYVRYRTRGEQSDDGHSAGELHVSELFASTPSGWSGLWSFVLNQDLMATFVASLRSARDPIFDLLAGPRRARAVVNDGVWVRIIDPIAALEARAYASPFTGVIEVIDNRGYAAGTYQVDLSPDGAEVVQSTKDPEITLLVADLGAIYIGRPALVGLARVGRVSGDMHLLDQADRAFAWDPQPWCPEIF